MWIYFSSFLCSHCFPKLQTSAKFWKNLGDRLNSSSLIARSQLWSSKMYVNWKKVFPFHHICTVLVLSATVVSDTLFIGRSIHWRISRMKRVAKMTWPLLEIDSTYWTGRVYIVYPWSSLYGLCFPWLKYRIRVFQHKLTTWPLNQIIRGTVVYAWL